MKKIILCTIVSMQILLSENKVCEYDQKDLEKTGYDTESLSIYKNKKICVSGKIEEKVKRGIRLISDNPHGGKTIHYVIFNLFEKEHIETLKKLPYTKEGDNINLVCDFGIDPSTWFSNCQFRELIEKQNLILKTNEWHLIDSKTLKKINEEDINIIWTYENKEWNIKTKIENKYKKISEYKEYLGYWILTKKDIDIK